MRIFVMLGTLPYKFDRLIDEICRISEKNKDIYVVAQMGVTEFRGGIECYDYMDHYSIINEIVKSNVVVSQGGYGSLKDCIENNAKIVAVPRYELNHETVADQKDLVDAFAQDNLVIPVYDIKNLWREINKAEVHKFSKYSNEMLLLNIAALTHKLINS